MSRTNSQINYDITARDAGASSAFAKLAKEMERTQSRAAMAKDQLGFAGNELDKFAKVGGIALIGRSLANATEKALELRDAFQAGKISASEMSLEILKAIPVIGEFAKTGENIRKLFDGRFEIAANDLKGAEQDKARLEARGKAQDNLQKSLQSARNQERTAVLGAGGDSQAIAQEQARQEFQRGMEEVKAREKELRDAGVIGGKEFKQLDELKQRYRNIYDAALVAARIEDAKARNKQLEDIRKKDEEAAKKLAEQRKEAFEKQQKTNELRGQFALEDQRDSILKKRDELQQSISFLESNRPKRGALAETVTDLGRSAQLSALERRSADPTIPILTASKQKLERIDKYLENIDNYVKEKRRRDSLGENDSIF